MKPARGRDLVSTTLDRYIKHRFNGELLPHQRQRRDDTTKNPSPDTTFKPTSRNNEHTHIFDPGEPKASFVELDDDSISEEQSTQASRKVLLDYIKQIDHTTGSTKNKSNTNTTTSSSSNVNNNNTAPPSICCFSVRNSQPCCCAVRDDLKFMAMGFESSLLYLWNLRSSKAHSEDKKPWFRKTLYAHTGPIYGLFFVPNSDLLLSCSEDTTIRLWCLKTYSNVAIYRGHAYPVWAIDIASHGNHFISGSMDTTARLWTFEKTSPVRIFCGHDSSVECVKFHPNGKYVATGSCDSTVRLWNVTDGNMVRLMVGHHEPVSCLSFLPDGKYLASSSHDGSIKIWDLSNNSVAKELSCSPNTSPINSISFSHNQVFLSSCGADRLLRIWRVDDISTKKDIHNYPVESNNVVQMDTSNSNK